MFENIIFNRVWEMPNANTFEINCIRRLIGRYHNINKVSVDPFANRNKIATYTNDIDPAMNANYNLDALDFLKKFEKNSVDLVLFDPPYSPRQISECYAKIGKSVNMETTQASFWSKLKNEIARITKSDSYVISFGWNTNGIGQKRGFQIVEILCVAHGGQHNDTLCTVEKKTKTLFD